MTDAVPGPFSPGSVSLGLYLQNLEPSAALQELLLQADLAASAGFDGVTLSEHHAGFEGYLPTPVLGASWLLDRIDTAWSAACPILLPLRQVNLLLEDIAWLSSRHPGRIGAGVAPGFSADDFALAGAALETRRRDFYRELPYVVSALQGKAEGLLADDPAVAACANHPVPVVAAVAGPIAARQAGKAGAGILIATFKDAAQAGELTALYRQSGGAGPRVARSALLGGRFLPGGQRRRQLPSGTSGAPSMGHRRADRHGHCRDGGRNGGASVRKDGGERHELAEHPASSARQQADSHPRPDSAIRTGGTARTPSPHGRRA